MTQRTWDEMQAERKMILDELSEVEGRINRQQAQPGDHNRRRDLRKKQDTIRKEIFAYQAAAAAGKPSKPHTQIWDDDAKGGVRYY